MMRSSSSSELTRKEKCRFAWNAVEPGKPDNTVVNAQGPGQKRRWNLDGNNPAASASGTRSYEGR
jgi:hypothetical protein